MFLSFSNHCFMVSLFLAQVLSLNHFFAFYFNIHHLHSTNINVFPQLHAGIHASSSFCGLQKLVSDSSVQSSPTPVHISFTTVSRSQHTEKIPNNSLGICSNSFIQSLDFSPEGHSFSLGYRFTAHLPVLQNASGLSELKQDFYTRFYRI